MFDILYFRKYGQLVVLFLAMMLISCQTPPSPTPESLTPSPIPVLEYATEAPISFLYPQDWVYQLPQQGILVFGEDETVNKAQPGPVMTILRVPNGQVHGTLEGELEHYLDFGPRQDGYELMGEIEETAVDNKNAFSLRMSFPGEGDRIPIETRIVAVEAENGAVYILAGTAPAEVWAENAPKFSIIIGSLDVME